MGFPDECDTQQKKADDNAAEDFGDDRDVVDQASELNAVMIDESCSHQRSDSREYNVAIRIWQAEKRHEITRERVGNARHACDELHDHDPSCPERETISGKRARPLIGVAGKRNLTSKLSEDHRHQKLPSTDDQPAPHERRATGAKAVSVIR